MGLPAWGTDQLTPGGPPRCDVSAGSDPPPWPAPAAGERVALVDDVVTTGGSVFRALEVLTPTGIEVAEVLVLVDREEGAAGALAERALLLHALFRRSQFSARS